MEVINYYLEMYRKLSLLYVDALNGKQNVLLELNKVYDELLESKEELLKINEKDISVVSDILNAANIQVRIINYVLEQKRELYSLDELRQEFIKLEQFRFNIINSYVMGIVKIDEINRFKEELEGFREKIYRIPLNHEILLEVAKMKSKVQHFYTEILEDEEVLNVAYRNEK